MKKIFFFHPYDQFGFTLLELIISLVIAAIAGTMLVQYVHTYMIDSTEPVLILQQDYRVIRGMENITAAYRSQLENKAFDLETFQTHLSEYAGDDDLTVVGTRISFDSDGIESSVASSDDRFLKVTVSDSRLQVIALFAE
jgi:prepilin-type N-terminal cleavage/methylation domain-containing protein